jgi:hypothetical protein
MGGSTFATLFDAFNITGIDSTRSTFSRPFSHSTSPQEATREAASATARKEATAQKAAREAQATASSQAQAAAAQKMRRIKSQSQTIFTSPLGIGGMAQTARKTLLGQ